MGAARQDHPSWEIVDEASEALDDVARLLEADADELTQTRNSSSPPVMSMIVLDVGARRRARSTYTAG